MPGNLGKLSVPILGKASYSSFSKIAYRARLIVGLPNLP